MELAFDGLFIDAPNRTEEQNRHVIRKGTEAIVALASHLETVVDKEVAPQHRDYCRAVLVEVQDLADRGFKAPDKLERNADTIVMMRKVRMAFTMQ
jgi:hypothetical protein